MLELVCVRHGQTAWNVDRRFQGQTNVPLDAAGRAQAAHLGARLRATPFEAAVSSDLERSAETARIILKGRADIPLRLDPDLREMAFGDWEGLTWAQIVERNPTLAAEDWASPKYYAPPGGEKFEDAVARAGRAVERMRATRASGKILVVTHAGILHALLRVVLGADEAEKFQVRFVPGSVTRFGLDGPGNGRLLGLNDGSVYPR